MRAVDEILAKTGYNRGQIELFLSECYVDFIYFCENVLGFKISAYHREWYELLEKHPRLAIQAFRGSGKTHFMAGYLLWKSIYYPGTKCLIVSHNLEQSKMVLKVIKEMILENEILASFAPDNPRQSWRANELTLNNQSIFYCKTYGEGIRGLRIDYCLCDEGGMYEDKSIFWTVVSPVVQLNRGRVIVIGTPKSPVDLLSELHTENEEYFSKKYPAEKDGRPMWGHKYTVEDRDVFGKRSLQKVRKEIGELPYQQEYLLVPISGANAVFPMEAVMNCLNGAKKFLPYGKTGSGYYVGVDLAVSETGDWNVYTVIEATNDGLTLVYGVRFRGGINEKVERLRSIVKEFNPVKILVDKTGLGEQIFQEFKSEFSAVHPFHFTAEEKHNIIMDLRHKFETYQITLPNSKEDNATYNFVQKLIKELQDFQIIVDLSRKSKMRFTSGKHDDMAISLALATRAAQDIDRNVGISLI